MNLRKYRELMAEPVPMMRLLAQDAGEWFMFMEFVESYFRGRAIGKPVVVEIGVMKNVQKVFYEELLGAVHIGIDINPNSAPDILANSNEPIVAERLKSLLGDRRIDLLFIDGNHSYDHVKCDYELFESLTKHIIALHDISATVNSDVKRFWEEITHAGQHTTISFQRQNTEVVLPNNKFINMGIGVIIKGNI